MKPTTWEFQEELIFKRYDSFTDRLVTVREFFRTAEQFLKLEKVECGGKLICIGLIIYRSGSRTTYVIDNHIFLKNTFVIFTFVKK